ncbi:MAG: response regulator containing CheY-like receiver domain and AraC-type DNA-binding domain, partial [Herbinix sp.]|nr:response regulator containing CheY-like receiver domain and AraC-type DNA-binding domain [Herbinix sp.]
MINLLIVDDDITTVEVIKDSIHWGEVGIDAVYTAYNVPNARKVLADQKVDIIISDIEMPQETGLDLLKWVREEKLECEFLLLTCHEKFSYATNAIHYDAAAYLTKPFDLAIMELNLQKIITKLRQKRDLQKNSEYGEWMEKNLRFMKLDFWKDVLEGEIAESRLETEIISRHLDIGKDKRYCLVYTKMRNIEGDIERYGKNVLEFVLEEFQSEILTGQVENESVVKFHTEDNLSYIT